MDYLITPDGFIAHFGIKGMRWGHRKQREKSNKDSRNIKITAKVIVKHKNDRVNDLPKNKKYKKAKKFVKTAGVITISALIGAGAATAYNRATRPVYEDILGWRNYARKRAAYIDNSKIVNRIKNRKYTVI